MGSDVVFAERRKTIKADGRISRGISAGALDFDLIARPQRHWQGIACLVIQNVHLISGGTGKNDRTCAIPIMGGRYPVLNSFLESFRQTAKLADVEKDPAAVGLSRFLRD